MNRPDLMALLGERVTVTNPNDVTGRAWTGTLLALADFPTLILNQEHGPQISLPQSCTVTLADDTRSERAERALLEAWPDLDGVFAEQAVQVMLSALEADRG